MQYSGLQVLSFVAMLLGTAAVVASIATDFWSMHSGLLEATKLGESYRGLWRSCVMIEPPSILGGGNNELVKSCNNRFDVEVNLSEGEVDLKHRNVATWEVACLGLMCASALLGILSLLFSPCCCNRCGGCLSFWALLAALCCAGGVGLFAYQTKAGQSRTVDIGVAQVSVGNSDQFGWSFWLAVAGGAAQLLASIGFGTSTARSHSYSQHI